MSRELQDLILASSIYQQRDHFTYPVIATHLNANRKQPLGSSTIKQALTALHMDGALALVPYHNPNTRQVVNVWTPIRSRGWPGKIRQHFEWEGDYTPAWF